VEVFLTAIGNFGFPVVVAGYLLFRFESKIEKLDASISDPERGLISTIKILSNKVENLVDAVDKNLISVNKNNKNRN